MVTTRVSVQPELYDFARARSGISDDEWDRRFGAVEIWRSGERQPTVKQLQKFARQTHTPFGLFLLPEPPVEVVPIADFRTVRNRSVTPDANLLETIYDAEARQEWFRANQILNNEDPIAWIGSIDTTLSPVDAAQTLGSVLSWGPADRNHCRTWEETLTSLREAAELVGVLVMIAGYAGRYTGRKLDPKVFRGFALVDQYAPVVFVNGADRKSAQIFTLVHELAHLLVGASGLSDTDPRSDHQTELWCNQTAAAFLVPHDEFLQAHAPETAIFEQLDRLARHFKVSTETILGRYRELGFIDWERYFHLRSDEHERIAALKKPSTSGGNYLNSRPVQVSKRFATELLASTYEGSTSFTEAGRLIGTAKQSTLRGIAEHLGVL